MADEPRSRLSLRPLVIVTCLLLAALVGAMTTVPGPTRPPSPVHVVGNPSIHTVNLAQP